MNPTLAALLNECLKGNAAVAALVSSRVYPDAAPQGVQTPYIVTSEIVSTAEESHDDANGLDATQVQISCYATTSLVALTIRKAVRAALFANGAMAGVKAVQPTQRLLGDDDDTLANAILELTFMHNPST